MTRPPLHVCIATGQNLPNLIAALQFGATRVVILETPEMRESAGWLQDALGGRGIACTRVPLDDATPQTLEAGAESIAETLDGQAVLLNVTGGTKLMALALSERLRLLDTGPDAALHMLYVETAKDRIDWLKPQAAMEPMEDVLALRDILLAYGYRIRSDASRGPWHDAADDRQGLTLRLGDKADKLAGFFGALNERAQRALRGGTFEPAQRLAWTPHGLEAETLGLADGLGLLAWDKGAGIVFASVAAAEYFAGGWLEEYAMLKLKRHFDAGHWAAGLVAETVRDKTENEFDALAAHRNRLLMIECKTARLGRDRNKDSDYLYKLAQLARRVGGILARPLFLSARDLDEAMRARARENGVDVLAAAEVRHLVDYVRRWKNPEAAR